MVLQGNRVETLNQLESFLECAIRHDASDVKRIRERMKKIQEKM